MRHNSGFSILLKDMQIWEDWGLNCWPSGWRTTTLSPQPQPPWCQCLQLVDQRVIEPWWIIMRSLTQTSMLPTEWSGMILFVMCSANIFDHCIYAYSDSYSTLKCSVQTLRTFDQYSERSSSWSIRFTVKGVEWSSSNLKVGGSIPSHHPKICMPKCPWARCWTPNCAD